MKKLFNIKKSILFVGCSVMAVAVTSCQSVDEKKKKPKELKVPAFVADAKAVAASTVPASEKPLIVTDIVPERAQGEDDLKLPERVNLKSENFAQPNFIKELMKGVKDPDKKLKVELDFDAMPLYDVVVGFSDLLGFDFIIDPAVKGSVSIKVTSQMKPADIWSVFESILATQGSFASRNNELIEIAPFAKMPQKNRLMMKENPANVEVALVQFKKISAATVLNQIKPFLTKGATVSEIKNLNALLIVEAPPNMAKIRELASRLDRQWQPNWPQISIKCHAVDTDVIIDELKSVIPIIGLPVSFDAAKPTGVEIKISSIPRLQVIMVSAPTLESLREIEKWVKILDSEDIGEQEQVYFYNIRHSTIEGLRLALDTFFDATGSKSTSKSKSVSSKSGTKKPTSKRSTSSNNTDSKTRSSAFESPVTVHEDTAHNRLVIRTTPRTYALVKALMERLDTPPLQVLIQATIVDLTLKAGLEYGFRYAIENGSGSIGQGVQHNTVGNPSATPAILPASSLDNLKSLNNLSQLGGSSGLNLFFENGNSALNFIASVAGRSNTSIVSSPQVIAISDEEAKIDITDQISISNTVQTGVNTSGTTQNWESKDASTTLTVTPHITANNEVSLDVKVTMEEFDETQLNNYKGSADVTNLAPPNLYKRSIETKLVVPDGETVLLGGMIKNKNTDYVEGIPWLMDLPYIGEFFKYTSKTKRRSELLVLMTVTVVDQKTRLELLLKRYQQAVKSIDEVLGHDSEKHQHLSIENELKNNFKEHGERWDELFSDDEEEPVEETEGKVTASDEPQFKLLKVAKEPELSEPKAVKSKK